MRKVIIYIVLMLFAMKVYAFGDLKIPLYDFEPVEGMYMINLNSNEYFPKIVLDCHSFIHGLYFYDEQNVENYKVAMVYGECEPFMDEVITRLDNGDACLLLEPDTQNYRLDSIEACDE